MEYERLVENRDFAEMSMCDDKFQLKLSLGMLASSSTLFGVGIYTLLKGGAIPQSIVTLGMGAGGVGISIDAIKNEMAMYADSVHEYKKCDEAVQRSFDNV